MSPKLQQALEIWIAKHRKVRPARFKKKIIRDPYTGRMRMTAGGIETDAGFGIITSTHTGNTVNPIPPYSLS